MALAVVLTGPLHAFAATIRSAEDLGRLSRDPAVERFLACLERIELLDGAADSFSPFETAELHRFRIRGQLSGRTLVGVPIVVESPAWSANGALKLGLDRPLLEGVLELAASHLPVEVMASQGLPARAATIRGTGVAGLAQVVLQVERRLGPWTFRGPVGFTVSPGAGTLRASIPGWRDLVHLLARGAADPRFMHFLRTARQEPCTGDACPFIPVRQNGAFLEVDLTFDHSLGPAAVLTLGGVYRLDLASGWAGFRDYAERFDELARPMFPELAAIARSQEVRWLKTRRGPGAHVHVELHQGGALVKVYSGSCHWVLFAVGDPVELVFSTIPPGYRDAAGSWGDLEENALDFLALAPFVIDLQSGAPGGGSGTPRAVPAAPATGQPANRIEPGRSARAGAVAAGEGAPADAAGDPARATCPRTSTVAAAGSLEQLSRLHPVNAVALVSLAEELAARDRRRSQELAREAHARLRELEESWATARVLAARGDFEGALGQLRRAVVRCPAEPSLWGAISRVRDAMGTDLPPDWPQELAVWARAGFGLHHGPRAIAPRLQRLRRPAEVVHVAAPAPGPSRAQAQRRIRESPDLAAWAAAWEPVEVAPLERPAWPELAPDGGRAWIGAGSDRSGVWLAAMKARPAGRSPGDVVVQFLPHFGADRLDTGLPADPSLVAGIVGRLLKLRLGGSGLFTSAERSIRLALVRLDPDLLFPNPRQPSPRPVPLDLLEALGPLKRRVVAEAMKRPMWLALFRIGPARGDGWNGPVVGVDVPSLDEGLVVRLPGGTVASTGQDLIELLERRLSRKPASSPARAAVTLADGCLSIECSGVASGELAALAAALARTPFTKIEARRLVINRARVTFGSGALRVLSPAGL
ncbi:MAG: hypothetical protein HY815_20860 [Candidatus Riflebacteria bacterium]|nr:hypothetical protein [Candidatus Riflebacteria bacterium]